MVIEIESLKIVSNSTIRQALELLDKTGLSTLFVVENNDELIGIVTDGIIRRALLKNYVLDDIVDDIMKTDYISFNINAENSEILNAINESVKIIPLLSEEKKLIDYASINKIKKISISSPYLNGNEQAYVNDCLKTNWISSQGKYVRKFENQFSVYHENFFALAVSNGTTALHLALDSLNIGIDDEVIVPDLTFAASINAILYTGATPKLVDVDPITWNICPTSIKKNITKKTKAIMVVHLYGNPCNMEEIMKIAKQYGLMVVEDCAEALGSYYNNKPVGVFGDVATFSFYGNKTITTGEGGMVLFKNKEQFEKGAIIRDHGMSKTKRYWHDMIGYNYRLTNIQAAIGVAQFEQLSDFVNAKIRIALVYNEFFSKYKFLQTPIQDPNTINSYWLYTLLVTNNAPFSRDELIHFLSSYGIESRPVFFPLHFMPPYINFGNSKNLTNSQIISRTGISLPSSVNLTEKEQEYICKKILEFILIKNK
jgi:perosamine synthetase